jgi:hypothetical protein
MLPQTTLFVKKSLYNSIDYLNVQQEHLTILASYFFSSILAVTCGHTVMYLFVGKIGIEPIENTKNRSEAAQNVGKQRSVDRKQASNELCTGVHNPLSQRGKRSER